MPERLEADRRVHQAAPARSDTPLAPLTTLGLGGPATILDVDNATNFADVVEWVNSLAVIPVCLGWGSNVLVAEQGTTAPVLLMRTTGIDAQDADHRVQVTVQAGHSLPDLVDFALAEGLIGIETLAGVPGTVGAMPIQNVGAYGQETADTLAEIVAWDWQRRQRVRLSAADCAFGHRTSIFKRSRRWTILTVTFQLQRSHISSPITYRELAHTLDVPLGSRLPATDVSAAVISIRRGKGMVLDPSDRDNRSVGSVFLGPTISDKQAADLHRLGAKPHTYPDGLTRVGSSWLIHEAGYHLGQTLQPGIRLSTKHYTLVADHGATSTGFATAAETIRQRVLKRTGINLTFEPDLIGDKF